MGCRQSSTALSPMERMAFDYILTQIPIQCQQKIIDLPKRKFLETYQNHLDAENHIREEKYLAAIDCECQAIDDLSKLLHPDIDHFIFADMNKLLSICYWHMEKLDKAYTRGQTALTLRLKHTPDDHKEISLQYSRLVSICIMQSNWKQADEYLQKAIVTARLSTDMPQGFVQGLEQILTYFKEKANVDSKENPVVHQLTSASGENIERFFHRTATDVLYHFIPEHNPIEIDQIEYKRLPDKQLETQITNEIFNEVLQNLEKYLVEDHFLTEFGIKGSSISFIAAYFKAIQMKTSTLSSAIIEAALTRIINRINNTIDDDDERVEKLKQSSFTISYTDEDEYRMKGVRVFQIKGKYSSQTK